MLDPEARSQTLETLRPPESYQLDYAIATTFSLDLIALLTAPLAFTLFDWEDEEGRTMADPLALLESLRRYADRISIFCQAGRIAVPKTNQRLLAYLEESIFQVRPAAGTVFHAKLWVLRFRSDEGPIIYRVVLPTRNLTFDRCWDTVLTLEGELIDRRKAYALNHPLADIIGSLPRMSSDLPKKRRDKVELIQDELRRVDFEIPEPFREMYFWSLGVSGKRRWPFQPGNRSFDRVLVMSPFVSDGCLSKLNGRRREDILISRPDELAKLSQTTISNFKEVLVLNPSANLIQDADEEAPDSASGIHAKLYIAEAGGQARVWTGSANATNAAFGGNVEFMVELIGDKSKCGIDAFLMRAAEETTFRDLLQEFSPDEVVVDAERERLEDLADDMRCALAARNLVAIVVAAEDESVYSLSLGVDGAFECRPNVEIRCRPVTLNDASAVLFPAEKGSVVTFGPLSFERITSFFAFEIEVKENQRKVKISFVLNARLEGAPADRKDRILTSLLSNKAEVMRFILFLLAEGGVDASTILRVLQTSSSARDRERETVFSFPLFEALVRTLDRNPAKLDQISRLINDLKKSAQGQECLPEGFDEIWQPVWTARESLRSDDQGKATKH